MMEFPYATLLKKRLEIHFDRTLFEREDRWIRNYNIP